MYIDQERKAGYVELYEEMDLTVDQLAVDVDSLLQFAQALNARVGCNVDSSQALAELFYMRKRGWLPRLRRLANSK
jgi:hypothetical protein